MEIYLRRNDILRLQIYAVFVEKTFWWSQNRAPTTSDSDSMELKKVYPFAK